MKRSRPSSIQVAAVVMCLVAVLTGWLAFRPYPRPAAHLVEPRLLALQEPWKSVETNYFTDGGSVGITIVDSQGHEEQFALPNRMMRNENHEKVFVGATHVSRPGAVPVANSDATKKELIRLLANYRKDPQVDFILAILSDRWSDKTRATANRLLGRMR